ncbi:MAG: hypothetical protein D4R77_14635 [Planctomycetaceae bacterium]|nr:MAG: hypothetical protein D4R77_14635 [Planctomycetaceae bacterium]
MVTRSHTLGKILALVFAWLTGIHLENPSLGVAAEHPGFSTTTTLEDRLSKGLRARLPSEFEFIKKVVVLVNQGVLPEKMVDKTFFWARRRQQIYPFPYFRAALLLQAQRIGLEL